MYIMLREESPLSDKTFKMSRHSAKCLRTILDVSVCLDIVRLDYRQFAKNMKMLKTLLFEEILLKTMLFEEIA